MKFLFQLILFISTFSLSQNCFAKTYIAKIVKLRGEATQLVPGKVSAVKLKFGDQLVEDTSIVTRDKSFVRIEFFDGSNISLGPNGKVVVSKMNQAGSGILTLLKGQMRSKINGASAEKTKNHKFLVKTKSAALGVRGTEFQTIYNPENNITNLLTYNGEVAIAKIDSVGSKDLNYEEVVDNISSNKLSKSSSIRIKNNLHIAMEDALADKNAVVVKTGQFSGALDSVDKATLPVNISPSQLNALYSNVDLQDVDRKTLRPSKLNALETKKNFLEPIVSDTPSEGVYNSDTGAYAQKSGGFIDVKTGLYIPPEKTSQFSNTKKVYIAQKVGNFDLATGQYIAPQGLVLDSQKGFVAQRTKNQSPQELKSKKTQALILNNIIDKKVVLKKMDRKKIEKYYNQLELFSKNSIALKVDGIGSTLKLYDSPQVNSRDLKTDGKGIVLRWDHSSGGKWQPITNISYRRIRFNGAELGEFNQATSSLYGMELGVRRYINHRFNLSSSIGLNQNFITASSTSGSITSYDLRKVTVPVIDFTGQWFFVKSRRYDLDLRLGLTYSLKKTARDVDFESGLGASAGLGARYWVKRNWWTKLDFSAKSSKHDISGTNFSATNEIINSALGLEIGYVL
ncbi:FecR domain-containing protein [Halobacteriovorax sp. HLS]|uniref:FecR family protein n=1 Tax=Halobacteriovorax sp. HLS TaxID=2234000 RepID=UPI000FDB0E2D|nr:FecR family protein [Halobacteriovorax sp. HLS]